MSLRLKLALSGTLLLALSIGLLTYYTLSVLRNQFEAQQQSRVLQLQPLLNAALAVPVLQRDYASVQAILEESLQDPSLRTLKAYDSAGRMVAAAQRSTPTQDAPGSLSEFRAELALAGQAIGSVSFSLSSSDLDAAQARITTYVLAAGSLALLFFSALLWVLSGTVTRRLQQLVDASQSIQQGQYAPALPAASNDEVGVLVRAFSVMGREIQQKVKELQKLNDGLERQVEQRTRDLTAQTMELDRSVRALQTKTYLLNRAPFAVLVLDTSTPGCNVVDTTEALSDVFGHAASDAIGRPVAWLETPGRDGMLASQLQQVAESGRSLEWEASIRCGSGQERWTRCLAFPLDAGSTDSQRIALCLIDIQEIWQAREDQRRLAGELQESNKLQSVSLAIAGISHDLNTPIGIAVTASTKMRDLLQPLEASPDTNPPVDDKVAVPIDRLRKLQRASELVASNLAKASDLVKGLKATTANVSRLEWRKVSLQPLLDSLLITLSPITHRARCAVRITCPADLALYTEPGSLSQVITNLVVNATVHAFEGRTDREIRIEVRRQGDQVLMRVSDNGNGMSPEANARAFSAFFTTNRSAGGSGLGLFSARRVVENVLGGTIDMHSTQGEGTEFRIVLPFMDRQEQVVMKSQSTSSSIS